MAQHATNYTSHLKHSSFLLQGKSFPRKTGGVPTLPSLRVMHKKKPLLAAALSSTYSLGVIAVVGKYRLLSCSLIGTNSI